MGEIWTGGEPVLAPTSMWSCLRGIRTYMENEGNKKGRDKLKDKKKSHFHAKFNQFSHLQSRESTSYGTPFWFAWELNQLSPTTIRDWYTLCFRWVGINFCWNIKLVRLMWILSNHFMSFYLFYFLLLSHLVPNPL